MTAAESEAISSAPLEEHLAMIDELLTQPFPEKEFRDDTGYGGPEYRVRVLRASQQFWDDHDGQAWVEAEAELRACLDALAVTLTTRLGNPLVVDLWPYLSTCISVRAWPLRDRDRWLALGHGQDDKETPWELLAAVGRPSAVDPE
ncbi:hypothetical protein [Streptomyces sp. NPDC058751]|uniref:hypothetical protein n=1 Tax=Streptomyces sp. NPDC058751 TaxID=3346623 RepID=UPI0036CE6561